MADYISVVCDDEVLANTLLLFVIAFIMIGQTLQ